MKRVAVIGTGAAGLATLRHLSARPSSYSLVAFEQTGNIGGTWVYTDETGYDEKGFPIHTSMYRDLKTNFPKEMMQFLDFPFPEHLPTFVGHQKVQQYLNNYTDNFDLGKYVQFYTVVTKVSPLKKVHEDLQWEVEIRKGSEHEGTGTVTEIFDAVCVCVGHYSVPYIPNIPGLNEFRGQILHSHDYRVPETFKDMRVVVLGAGFSGQDISLMVAKEAKQVILSHNKESLKHALPANVRQTCGIERVTYDSAIMHDGEIYKMDALILCTGYNYSIPFLSPECQVSIKDNFVAPLFKHLIHIEYPSLIFIGLCSGVLPFPNFEIQIKFVLSVWEGVYYLPSQEQMKADTQRDSEKRLSFGIEYMHAGHFLGYLMPEYEKELALLGKFHPNTENIYEAFLTVLDFIFRDKLYNDYRTWNVPKTKTGLIDIQKWALYPKCKVKN